LLATLLSLLAGFYIVGFHWSGPIGLYQQLQIVMFLVLGLTISLLGEKHRNVRIKLAQITAATEKRKDDFLAMLGHELRNPLSGITSAARLMVHPELDQHLISDLLDVSRVTRGQVVIEKAPVELLKVMHAAVEQVRDMIEHCEHQLVLNLPTSPVWVLGDKPAWCRWSPTYWSMPHATRRTKAS
jgi:signal transduction histidine kinase